MSKVFGRVKEARENMHILGDDKAGHHFKVNTKLVFWFATEMSKVASYKCFITKSSFVLVQLNFQIILIRALNSTIKHVIFSPFKQIISSNNTSLDWKHYGACNVQLGYLTHVDSKPLEGWTFSRRKIPFQWICPFFSVDLEMVAVHLKELFSVLQRQFFLMSHTC